jgi:SAM-dependent methyltransferase
MLLVVSPYRDIAPAYDCTVGIPFFLRLRDSFEEIVRRYGIQFHSAADVGCGTGLFACYLNLCWGVPVYAVDNSAAMLRQAQRNCRGADVCLLQQDIRCLALPSPVDLITANFDTLNHLKSAADLRVSFQRIATNLRPGGHFYFDVLTPCQLASRYEVLTQNRCVKKSWLQQRIDWDPRTRLLRTVALEKRGGCCLPAITRVTERAYEPREIGTWLSDAGFIVRGVHDAETLQVATGCPPRIIVVAQKTAWSDRIKLKG